MRPWWDEWPSRLEYELNELKQVGGNILEVEKDADAGLLQVTFTYILNGKETKFEAEYPPTYPYTRFELYAPDLDLKHHQNPLLKNLCVLPRRSENWDLAYTVGGFLRERVGQVIAAASAPDAVTASGLEVEQAEPVATYLPYANDSNVLIDPEFHVPPIVQGGTFNLGIRSLSENTLRGAVLDFWGSDGSVIYAAPQNIRNLYKSTRVFKWARSENLPIVQPKAFESELAAQGVIAEPEWTFAGSIDVRGIVAPDEIAWRTQGETLVCLVRVVKNANGFRSGKYWSTFLARPDRLPRASIRAPELAALPGTKIAVVGAGCLGAAAALEFARAGVGEIRIMDSDVVEAPTTMRWPLGLPAAGRQKVIAVWDFITTNYPNTSVVPVIRRYGATERMGGAGIREIENFFADADLIYDATAEEGISYPLSEEARRRSCIYVNTYGLPGAWGGRVVRIRPNVTNGCWVCYKLAVEDGTIPTPPSDQTMVQPVGCSEPTFIGSNFDMQQVTLLGVRVSILSLVEGAEKAPPDMAEDVFTLSLRTSSGAPAVPDWKSSPLLRHKKCENH